MTSTTLITKFAHLQIPLEDVLNATNNFHVDNIIGRGGLGQAYKGQLQRSEKLTKIAALRVDFKHGEGDVEFWTEISMLSDLKHTNIISLIGFCDEKGEKIIITTYAANGSLKEHLSNTNLTWTQRLKICLGVARALSYLHYDERRGYGVVHLNINSSTILLDNNWEAKLSGFKVSVKQSLNQMDRVILSEPMGTIGYVDPEIVKTKGVTNKSDIYSFGVVLFEILCGRRAYIKQEANRFLAPLAKYHYENETLHDIIHPDLRDQMSLGSCRIYSKMAYSCLKEERAHRPDMLNVIDELEKALEFRPQSENFVKKLEHLKIGLTDIKLATSNFSNGYRIAITSCHTLYRGSLYPFDKENHSSGEDSNNGEQSKEDNKVLIKRCNSNNTWVREDQFFTEIEMLTRFKHPNIITLVGFCVEGSEMILVYEDAYRANLHRHLGNANLLCALTWEIRLKICIDIAQALNYLHNEMEDQRMIINRDICSQNISLNKNFRAMIFDFRPPTNKKDKALYLKSFNCDPHLDPEYTMARKLKSESDAYCLGIILFEILCGKSYNDPIYLKESSIGLADLARRNFYTGTLEDMIDPIVKEETCEENSFLLNSRSNNDSLHTFIGVAIQCVAETPDLRPTMKVVVKELEEALFFHVERIQRPNTDQVVNQLEKLQSTHEIPVKKFEHLKIPIGDILLATEDFSHTYQIERFWDSYRFYRAELNHYDKGNHSSKRHSTVIIKRCPPVGHHHYGEKQFLTEIEILTGVKHPNIVTLLGFCIQKSMITLVIENFSNGFLSHYLENNIHNNRIFTWEKRLKICIDVAHALNYIHCEMDDQKMIVNGDITCYNIGLDENWGAKIVHFWCSVIQTSNQEVLPSNLDNKALSLNWHGRQSYMDPECKKTGKLKRESDVYSFGVVLLEILCGRFAFDPIYMTESDKGIADVARQNFYKGTLKDMIDPIIKAETNENNFVLNSGPNKDSLNTFIEVALRCVADTQDQRPTMKVVVRELEKALFYQNNNMDNPKMSLDDIKRATQNFHNDNCIGGGGFGKVYKGKLQDGDGFKTIVAKRLDTRFGQGEQQFLSELQILMEYKHENIIGLVGYCDEKDEKVIVYEYAPKRSLDRYLNDVSLTWVKRLNICIDVASALDFLHGGVGRQAKVIHRDIKTANILLNHDWKAKLADFGLSLISSLNKQTDYVIDRVCGTPGYLDPLYKKSGFLTIESDIYSFGVVLFEVLSGRSTFEIHKNEGHYLPDFVENIFEEGKQDELVFERIREQIVRKSLTTFLTIAHQCLHHERDKRPTTKEVITELKKSLEFEISKGE